MGGDVGGNGAVREGTAGVGRFQGAFRRESDGIGAERTAVWKVGRREGGGGAESFGGIGMRPTELARVLSVGLERCI